MRSLLVAPVCVAFVAVLGASPTASSGHVRPVTRTAKQLQMIVKQAIAAEKRALKAFESDKAAAKRDLQTSLTELKKAAASSALDPSYASATSDLKQAVAKDEIAIENLSNKHEQSRARNKINEAIVRKEAAAAVYARAADHQPIVSPITATFEPQFFETVYTITASDPDHDRLLREWELSPPAADPNCDNFTFDNARPNKAIWHHGDGPEDTCDHSKEGPRGHQGTVTVKVSDNHWTCTASYAGTISGTGAPAVCKPSR